MCLRSWVSFMCFFLTTCDIAVCGGCQVYMLQLYRHFSGLVEGLCERLLVCLTLEAWRLILSELPPQRGWASRIYPLIYSFGPWCLMSCAGEIFRRTGNMLAASRDFRDRKTPGCCSMDWRGRRYDFGEPLKFLGARGWLNDEKRTYVYSPDFGHTTTVYPNQGYKSVSDIFHSGKRTPNSWKICLCEWASRYAIVYIVVPKSCLVALERSTYSLANNSEKYSSHNSLNSKISLLVRWIWKGWGLVTWWFPCA